MKKSIKVIIGWMIANIIINDSIWFSINTIDRIQLNIASLFGHSTTFWYNTLIILKLTVKYINNNSVKEY